MNTIPKAAEAGTEKLHSDIANYAESPDWITLRTQQDPDLTKLQLEYQRAAAVRDLTIEGTRQEQLKLAQEEKRNERERLKRDLLQPQPVDPSAIKLEFAMANDTATVRLEHLVDPYLPSRCVVGFFGRGSTAKSSFLATMAAQISDYASTLWVSVEEPSDWIKARHIKAGGVEGTLAVFVAVAGRRDKHDRVIGSSFNIFEHLEPAIISAKKACEANYNPPRPLRLVVLDTAVGLTAWTRGESPNDDAAVKRLLGYLQHLAESNGVTIAIIGHSNKGKHEHFADTVTGASAWTNSPRLSFVHARDQREEHAYVMRVAKSNLTTRFGLSYTTEPIHILHRRSDGPDTVLTRVDLGALVWGEEESLDLFEAATRKPSDEEGCVSQKQTLVETVVNHLVHLVYASAAPITRDMLHAHLGREIGRREWLKIDERLNLLQFQHRIFITKGEQNKVLYQKQT